MMNTMDCFFLSSNINEELWENLEDRQIRDEDGYVF